MLNLIRGIFLPGIFCFSTFVLANEIEVNMENVLEVGRENQTLSATSQNKSKVLNFIKNKKESKYKLSLI